MNIKRNSEHDHALFDLLKQGDEVAFGKIYSRYWAELYNAAYKRLPEKEKCQDIIQNIFTDLWNRKAELDLENPVAYLHTAVRFQTLKHLARSPKNSFFGKSFENELISPLQADGILLEKEVAGLLELFIKALPEKRRNIFIMHYFEGLSTAKIAFELDISQKTVQNQLANATQALRLRLTHLFLVASAVISAIS